MLRILLILILLVHGLIHIMGFAKAFKFAGISQLTQPVSRTLGVLWLLSAALFLAAAILYLLKMNAWWMVAAPAVILSQLLIFSSWTDAKFGTIANVIVLLAAVAAFGA